MYEFVYIIVRFTVSYTMKRPIPWNDQVDIDVISSDESSSSSSSSSDSEIDISSFQAPKEKTSEGTYSFETGDLVLLNMVNNFIVTTWRRLSRFSYIKHYGFIRCMLCSWYF